MPNYSIFFVVIVTSSFFLLLYHITYIFHQILMYVLSYCLFTAVIVENKKIKRDVSSLENKWRAFFSWCSHVTLCAGFTCLRVILLSSLFVSWLLQKKMCHSHSAALTSVALWKVPSFFFLSSQSNNNTW